MLRNRNTHRSGWGLAAGIGAAALLGAAALYVRRETRRAERAHPPTGKFVEVDGVRLHFVDTGGGGPVLLVLHGNGAMIADMEISGLVDAMARRYRVIVFDRPGYGHSDRPRGRLWSAAAQAALVDAALERLGIERALLLGHSWGTQVALRLALDHPQRVAGLVLVSGYYFPTLRADTFLLTPPAIPVIGDVMRHTVSPLLGRALAPKLIARMFAPQPVPERFAAEFPLGLSLRPGQLRASAEETALMVSGAAGLEARYGELRLPVVIVAGTDDRIATFEHHAARLHEAIPGSELRALGGRGHMLHHYESDEIVDAIDTVRERAAEARIAAE
ncbi:alpha/beta fold hydrolase [Arenibaculum pallidiluteum]|uniref:alpha/beta fold hydrolase n=1 Tax=Arenibaculum pallidiluteum TaxID=2812559 RepID=UPI001A97981A|nr:alpha/beta hydrolase [Arenibaculum pallidiluteum]